MNISGAFRLCGGLNCSKTLSLSNLSLSLFFKKKTLRIKKPLLL